MKSFHIEDLHVKTMVKIKNSIKATKLSLTLSSMPTSTFMNDDQKKLRPINSLYDEMIKRINQQINELIEKKLFFIRQLCYQNCLLITETKHSSTKTLQSIFIDDDFNNKIYLYKSDKPLILEDLYFHLNVKKIKNRIFQVTDFNVNHRKNLIRTELKNYPTLRQSFYKQRFFIYPAEEELCVTGLNNFICINAFAVNTPLIKKALSAYNDVYKYLSRFASLHNRFLNFSQLMKKKFNCRTKHFMVPFSTSKKFDLANGIYGISHEYTDTDFIIIKQAIQKIQLQRLYHVDLEPLIINQWIYSIRYDLKDLNGFDGYNLFVICFLSKPIFIVTDKNDIKLPTRKARKLLIGVNYKSIVQEINDRFYSNEDLKKRILDPSSKEAHFIKNLNANLS